MWNDIIMKHLASVVRYLYFFLQILVGEKYILGIGISRLKSIDCILIPVYLVSIGWIFKFVGSVLSLKNFLHC